MTTLMISSFVEIDTLKRFIVLPKVSMLNFTISSNNSGANAGNITNNNSNIVSNVPPNTTTTVSTPMDCLFSLLYYMSKEDRALVTKLIADSSNSSSSNVNIRFRNQRLRCRRLKLYNPITAADAMVDVKDMMDDGCGGSYDDDYGVGAMGGDYLVDIYQEMIV